MYAIAFDMSVAALKEQYPGYYTGAYYQIKLVLSEFEFYSVEGSLYLSEKDDLANLYLAIEALKGIDWFRTAVRDIRAFRLNDRSDFTEVVKGEVA
jgi:virulence-associated protein D